MSAAMSKKDPTRRRLWLALGVFLLLSAVMYGSIMYKIIHYGP